AERGAGRPPLRLNPIQRENALAGSTGWLFPDAVNHEVEGYASELSVQPGDTLHLHVSTNPAAPYRIAVYRIGWYAGRGARLVECVPAGCADAEPGAPEPVSSPDPATGEVRTQWPVTDVVAIGADWTSGYYLARLVLADGKGASGVLFVVRETPKHHA